MFVGNLFYSHPINFPVDEKLVIIHGENGTGKTKTTLHMKKYYEENGENVLYFPADRKLTISKEDIDKFDLCQKLMGKQSLIDSIEYAYDIKDPFYFEFNKKGNWITSGYGQLINFFYNIALNPEKDLIVIIDNIERSLHLLVQRKIINDLMSLSKIKQLIVTTYSPTIAGNENTYHIKDIVDINEGYDVMSKLTNDYTYIK